MIGKTLYTTTAFTAIGPTDAAIVGEDSGAPVAALRLTAGQYLTSGALFEGESGDAGNLPAFTVELWLRAATVPPGADQVLVAGPYAASPVAAIRQYFVGLSSSGLVQFSFLDSSGQTDLIQASTALVANAWTHVVAAYGANTISIYLNGSLNNSAAAGGTCWPDLVANADFRIGDSGTSITMDFDEVAFYRYQLSAARVLAHYQAGRQRGYPQQATGARIGAVLDSANSHAPRQLGAGQRTITARYLHGQAPLSEISGARSAEAVDAIFFTARDGTLTFLDAAHRSSSPYSTVQATFDDDGTDLPYVDIAIDYSDSFIANDWSVTRQGSDAVTQTASDATSISRYWHRPQAISGIPVTTDAQALTIGQAMLAKYKEPLTRITSLTLATHVPDVAEAIFRRDIGDRIRVFRTPPGGGARIDQTLFIQKIDISGSNDGRPWQVRWGVSPL